MRPATPVSMRRHGGLLAAIAALVICFIEPIVRLVEFIFTSEFNSYIILVPFITLYLLWTRTTTPPTASKPDRRLSLFLCLAGFVALACFWGAGGFSIRLLREDSLAIVMLAFVLILLGICSFFLPADELRASAFPLGFLILIVPFPSFLRTAIEESLQVGSALTAHWMFEAAGMPVYYRDLTFQLPDITLMVAPECSGIQSTVALFITSLLAGHIFLRTKWRRSALTIAVLPLAVLRNGFRIFTIGELCVHMGPEMIHSYIHRRGGPIFFALSLIPFLLLLFFLIRSERPKQGLRKST